MASQKKLKGYPVVAEDPAETGGAQATINFNADQLDTSEKESILGMSLVIQDEKGLLQQQIASNMELRERIFRRHNSRKSAITSHTPYEEFMSFPSFVEATESLGPTDLGASNVSNVGDSGNIEIVASTLLSTEFEWFHRVPAAFLSSPFVIRLHVECLHMLEWLEPTPCEEFFCQKVTCKIEVIAKFLWNCSETHVFGSWATGLCLPGGDIDLCILKVPGETRMSLKLLAYVLCKLKIAQSIELIETAKVPILKYVDRETGLLADISINQESSLKTTKFLTEQLHKFKHLRPLIILVKLFLRLRGLNDTYSGGIGSFLLACMVLSFLQLNYASAYTDIFQNCLLSHLLIDFFFCWSCERNLRTHAASVRGLGCLFPRVSRKSFSDLSMASLFAIENPLDTDVDIGSNAFNSHIVCESFKKAFLELKLLGNPNFPSTCSLSKHSVLKSLYDPTHPIFTIRRSALQVENSNYLDSLISDVSNPNLLRHRVVDDILKRLQIITATEDLTTVSDQLDEMDLQPGLYAFELLQQGNTKSSNL